MNLSRPSLMAMIPVSYTHLVDMGDYVIVVNAEKVAVTGKKLTQKLYHHHTGSVSYTHLDVYKRQK